jgi:ketosteroid isomerase-like protein
VVESHGRESDFVRAFRVAFEDANRAWNEGDMKRAYAALADDVDYRLAPSWPSARSLRGRDEVIEFFQDLRATFPDVRAELLEFIQADETTVVAGSRVMGSGATSRAVAAMEIWQVWEMRPQLVPFRVTEFLDRRAALTSVGLKEGAQEGAR